MYENIDARIYELKEIALQITNLLDIVIENRKGSHPSLIAARGYLRAITNGEVEKRARGLVISLEYSYEVQILYVLNNLQQWCGNDARQYKLLLKEYLAYFRGKVNTGKLSESVNPLWQAIRGIGD